MPIISEPGDLCWKIEIYSPMGVLESTILSVEMPLREEATDYYDYSVRRTLNGVPIVGSIGQGFDFELSDRSGIIFSAKQKLQVLEVTHPASPNFLIYFRNGGCKHNELMCHSDKYPGFSCLPLPPVSERLKRIDQSMRR